MGGEFKRAIASLTSSGLFNYGGSGVGKIKVLTTSDGVTFICECKPPVLICKCLAKQTKKGWVDWLYSTKAAIKIVWGHE